MSIQNNAVHCVFYSHPWAIDALRSQRVGSLEDTLIVELGRRSQFASMVDRQRQERDGIAGLLADPDRLEELAEHHPRFPAPIVLAPNPGIAETALISSVSLLPTLESRYSRFLVFVHLSEYEAFRYAYPYCDRFMFLWDIADAPVYPLGELGRMLEELKLLSRTSWGGFFWFSHPKRRIGDPGARVAQLKGALRNAPMLAAPFQG